MSWLESELREQPAALARLLERQGEQALELGAVFRREDVRYILIASRGSPSNAARAAPELGEYAAGSGATVVARGVNYATAHEIALKIRELSGLVVEAYSPADLMHGPIAAIQPGWPIVLVAPTGPAHESVAQIVPAL